MSEKDFCEGYLLGIMGGAIPSKIIFEEDIPTFPAESELYIYGEMVLYSPKWDLEKYQYAIISYETDQSINFYFSENAMYCETIKGKVQAVLPSPLYRYQYNYTTHAWGNLTSIQEPVRFNENKILWSTRSLIKPNGQYFFKTASPEKFQFNQLGKEVAFLKKNGSLILQSDTYYDGEEEDIAAIFVNWQNKTYDTYDRAPWLRFHQNEIQSVTIKEGVNPLSTKAYFYMCENLESATLNTEITTIGEMMFYKTNLRRIPSLSYIKRIEKNAFFGLLGNYSWFEGYEITIPANVEYIGSYAFSNLHYFRRLTLNGAIEIDVRAFANNKNLSNVYIGSKTKKIHPYAFETIGLSYHTGHLFDEHCAKITFEDTSNWYVSKSDSIEDGTAIDVTNARQNGINISCLDPGQWNAIFGPRPPVEEGKYKSYYWLKDDGT